MLGVHVNFKLNKIFHSIPPFFSYSLEYFAKYKVSIFRNKKSNIQNLFSTV